MNNQKQVVIYTDGACSGNPGPGGYGVVMLFGEHRKELSGGFRKTTNNRMELLGAIESLRALKERCSVKLHTDSQYVVNAIEKGWAAKWKANGWMRNKTDKAVNPDLWICGFCPLCFFKLLMTHKKKGNAMGRIDMEKVKKRALNMFLQILQDPFMLGMLAEVLLVKRFQKHLRSLDTPYCVNIFITILGIRWKKWQKLFSIGVKN
jgi:ribonuclease HI